MIGGYRLLWVTMWASVLGFIMQVSILTIADMGFGFILIIDTTNILMIAIIIIRNIIITMIDMNIVIAQRLCARLGMVIIAIIISIINII